MGNFGHEEKMLIFKQHFFVSLSPGLHIKERKCKTLANILIIKELPPPPYCWSGNSQYAFILPYFGIINLFFAKKRA